MAHLVKVKSAYKMIWRLKFNQITKPCPVHSLVQIALSAS